jgi:N-acetylglutamate synthase-like GNAT family acetyltransferase
VESKYTDLYTKLHPRNSPLKPIPERRDALFAARGNLQTSKSFASFNLTGLAIHPDYQGYGIGSMLVRWGMDEATKEGVPVFTGGETKGVMFYDKALGFKRVPKTEYWLDREAKEITRAEVEAGNEAWTAANDGVSGAEVFWCPEGVSLNVDEL